MSDNWAEDALLIEDDTDVEELKAFLKRRTMNPIKIGETTVWNYNSHEVQKDALRKDEQYKLSEDKYIIPYQVTGIWGFMFHLLPDNIREAEVLVYHSSENSYRAYRNFYAEMPSELAKDFTTRLSKVSKPPNLEPERVEPITRQ